MVYTICVSHFSRLSYTLGQPIVSVHYGTNLTKQDLTRAGGFHKSFIIVFSNYKQYGQTIILNLNPHSQQPSIFTHSLPSLYEKY
jgi:hypothetical protein